MNDALSIRAKDRALDPLVEKVLAGVWLDQGDGEALFRSNDLHTIGKLANVVKHKLHGDVVFYNRNRHINYTNVCALNCKFCSFYRKRGEAGAYEMPVEQVVSTAKKAWEGGATEVHIVGGLHPWLKFDYYTDMLRGIKSECPELHIKAFTAIEIIHFSRIARMSVDEVLIALQQAGLGSLPGGGAEIFDDRVHDEIFKGKVRADKWFEVHRAAHRLGIFSNATMLYGHVENVAERVGHLIKLRELQAEALRLRDERQYGMGDGQEETLRLRGEGLGARGEMTESLRSKDEREQASDKLKDAVSAFAQSAIRNPQSAIAPAAQSKIQESKSQNPPHLAPRPLPLVPNAPAFFNCIIPLSFIPENSELGALPGPTGLADLKTLAIARLMVPNIAHIKAFWIMQGVGLSQIALNWGCDDLDGTVVWYDITKREGDGTTHQELHVEDIKRLIREAGKEPVERDTLYRPIRRDAVLSHQPIPAILASEH